MSMRRSPKRRKLEEEKPKWSKLCRDVLRMVLERLSSTDFDRAKAVCSAWRCVSRESIRKQSRIPWLILLPYERSNGSSCHLLNPAEKGLIYKTPNLGLEFAQSRCIATSGNWILMYLPQKPKLYVLNPLTRERINLPPLESRKKHDFTISPSYRMLHHQFMMQIQQSGTEWDLTDEIRDLTREKAVLWVDERSKDYLVLWSHRQSCLFFSKKGDDFWKMFPYVQDRCADLVYKDHMLYIYTLDYTSTVFDFSGDSPVTVIPCPYFYFFPPSLSKFETTRIAVTTSGEILMVRCYDIHTTFCSFYLYKMNHTTKHWDDLASLGDQALILDLGVTVPATEDIQGIKKNSIYFSGTGFGTKHIFIYNLATRKVEPFPTSTRSKFFDARWFLPS